MGLHHVALDCNGTFISEAVGAIWRSADVGERGGEWGKQVGSMNEESQGRGCYNITFICTKQETVSVLEKTQANKTS